MKTKGKTNGDVPTDRDIRKATEDTLERLGSVAIKAFQKEVRRSSWNRTPSRLLNSFSYEVKNGALKVTSDHPAAMYLNKGVKPHSMSYLEDAKKPIPIITETGELIYRTASSQSLSDGSWKHPGISGKHFMERGQDAAVKAVKEELLKTYKELLKQALKD